MKVFLGGTSGKSTWRNDLIPKLEEKEIEYFNPQLPEGTEWTEECMLRELKERKECDVCVYCLTKEMTGFYSIAEVIDDSHLRPDKTVLCYSEEGFEPHQIKSLKQIAKMVERIGAGTVVFSKDKDGNNDFSKLMEVLEEKKNQLESGLLI